MYMGHNVFYIWGLNRGERDEGAILTNPDILL